MADSILNLKKLLTGAPVRLRYVERFSTCRVSRTESVAEHSYFTALYSWMICRWLQDSKRTSTAEAPRLELVLSRAIFHDMEEPVSGDLNRTYKLVLQDFCGPQLAAAEQWAFRKVWEDIVQKDCLEVIHEHWKNAKNLTDYEGQIVAFADFLSVLSYLYEEARASNRILAEHAENMRKYMDSFKGIVWSALAPLVQQAEDILDEVLGVKEFDQS